VTRDFSYCSNRSATTRRCPPDPEDYAVLLIVPGAIVTAVGLLGLLTTKPAAPPAPAPVVDPSIQQRATQRDQAWQLTQQAANAARANDCATVAQLDVDVRQLDADLHATVFLRDVAIERCLANRPAP
jgi:hypothetical protein